jgi:hypothetical protein
MELYRNLLFSYYKYEITISKSNSDIFHQLMFRQANVHDQGTLAKDF